MCRCVGNKTYIMKMCKLLFIFFVDLYVLFTLIQTALRRFLSFVNVSLKAIWKTMLLDINDLYFI